MSGNWIRTMAYLCLSFVCFQFVVLPNSTAYAARLSEKQISNQINLTQFPITTDSPMFEPVDSNMKSVGQVEEVQIFSFVAKSFATSVSQPVTIEFNSSLPADEVVVRVPDEGEIIESELPQGVRIERSHGEYWRLKTAEKQTTFTLTVAFITPGDYFLTIDHDTDHFYLKVMEEINNSSLEPTNEIEGVGESDSIEVDDELVQPIIASEENLVISEDIISVEEERILEATRDETNRSTSNVSSWSQFRSAWNSSSTTVIQLSGTVRYSSGLFTSLNARSSSIAIRGRDGLLYNDMLDMGDSSEMLVMSGSGILTIFRADVDSLYLPVITQSGSGRVVLTNRSSVFRPVVAQNILIEFASVVWERVTLTNNGTLEIYDDGSTRQTGISASRTQGGVSFQGSNHDIYIRGKEFLMRDRFSNASLVQTWEEVDLHLRGSSEIISALTTPDDFISRYPGRLDNFEIIVLNGRSGGQWEDPPLPSGEVTITYSDMQGNSLLENDTFSGVIGEKYETQPKDIPGYVLVDIPENKTGVFTIEPITVSYVYDEQKDINPLDPLDPEKEVSPENPPPLPNDQGLFSIDFVSQFSFGEQGISTRLMHYHANPQNLLDAEGTVIENEERPNYVQISDRRAENERHGWVLAVTQNSQFKNSQNHELSGARLHLSNQQFASTQNGNEPQLTHKEGVVLIPEQKTELLTANKDQGTGTWIYRFGDGSNAGESVTLEVPETAAPKATTYQTTLTWELSAIPENE